MPWSPELPAPDPRKAGRQWSPSPWPRPGENEQMAHERWKMEWDAFQLDPASVATTAETAQITFAGFLKQRFAPSLRDLGFKGSGSRYRFDRQRFQGGLSFQNRSIPTVLWWSSQSTSGYGTCRQSRRSGVTGLVRLCLNPSTSGGAYLRPQHSTTYMRTWSAPCATTQ